MNILEERTTFAVQEHNKNQVNPRYNVLKPVLPGIHNKITTLAKKVCNLLGLTAGVILIGRSLRLIFLGGETVGTDTKYLEMVKLEIWGNQIHIKF